MVICLTGRFSTELEQDEELLPLDEELLPLDEELLLLDEDVEVKEESLLDEEELEEDELDDEEELLEQHPVDFGFSSRNAVKSGRGGTLGSDSTAASAKVLVTRDN